jgi:hypothetical protein
VSIAISLVPLRAAPGPNPGVAPVWRAESTAQRLDATAVWGAGFGDWWQKHGQQVVEFAGCMLDGAGVARFLIAGVSGVGGVLAAAGLVVGALACLS